MTPNEGQRLAHAINDLRPDWPISSLATFFGKHAQLRNRPLRDVAVAMVWVATDVKADGTWASEKPARVLEAGPWWQQVIATDSGGRSRPPKRDEECPLHPGQHQPPYCAGCRTAELTPPEPDPEPIERGERTWAEHIRSSLQGAS